jgi:hypothetical protein
MFGQRPGAWTPPQRPNGHGTYLGAPISIPAICYPQTGSSKHVQCPRPARSRCHTSQQDRLRFRGSATLVLHEGERWPRAQCLQVMHHVDPTTWKWNFSSSTTCDATPELYRGLGTNALPTAQHGERIGLSPREADTFPYRFSWVSRSYWVRK